MTNTYADITVGSIVDGEIIVQREVFVGGDWEFIRLTGHLGGRRTEPADFDASEMQVHHIADPTLVDVPTEDLMTGVAVFAHNLRRGYSRDFTVEGLHGLALEVNRRRALDCIALRCVCHGKGH